MVNSSVLIHWNMELEQPRLSLDQLRYFSFKRTAGLWTYMSSNKLQKFPVSMPKPFHSYRKWEKIYKSVLDLMPSYQTRQKFIVSKKSSRSKILHTEGPSSSFCELLRQSYLLACPWNKVCTSISASDLIKRLFSHEANRQYSPL